MLCSSCSRNVRPVVAIDIDGTLGDYHKHFHEFAQMYVGHPLRSIAEYGGLGSLSDHLGMGKSQYREVKLAYRQGGLKRNMPIFEHASVMMNGLANRAEVWITTTRPHARLDNIDPDTQEWLRRHKIPYHGLLYDADKYKLLSERVDPSRVVAVLDDLPEQWEAAYRLFGEGVPVLRRNDYNTLLTPRPREASSCAEAVSIINQMINAWEIKYNDGK